MGLVVSGSSDPLVLAQGLRSTNGIIESTLFCLVLPFHCLFRAFCVFLLCLIHVYIYFEYRHDSQLLKTLRNVYELFHLFIVHSFWNNIILYLLILSTMYKSRVVIEASKTIESKSPINYTASSLRKRKTGSSLGRSEVL